ncbi:MAG: lycopene cyclase family protein [Paludibacter sp.]|nr:lycopene cyclase family protein [Paludibacter sp.]
MATTLSTKTYDYIIAGAGCAGLSLLYRILLEPELCSKEILIIDREKKSNDDITWCFWEKSPDIFEPTVYHQWDILDFKSQFFNNELDIIPYTYKMIRGLDFYNFVYQFATACPNVHFMQSKICSMQVTGDQVEVATSDGTYKAAYAFNSTRLFQPGTQTDQHSLYMHFKGLTIRTEAPVFNHGKGTLMDFNVNQHDGMAFMYMLPTSPNEALLEYTVINGVVLNPGAYDEALQTYINEALHLSQVKIVREESGIIPMTKKKFPVHHKQRIIHIGTAGGCVKASSGYAFQFIQRQTAKIVMNLKQNRKPIVKCSFRDKKFNLYDNAFLEVLISGKMRGDELMSRIFKYNSGGTVLAFLDNESSFTDEFNMMTTLPANIFLPVTLKEFFRKAS